jgi:hypothetical protein
MHCEEVLHRFIQYGHDPPGWSKGLNAEGEPGPDARLDVDHREINAAAGVCA